MYHWGARALAGNEGGTGMERIVITRRWCNIYSMQVCTVEDATDEEILAVCNRDNPAGTTNGWMEVVRETLDERIKVEGPIRCDDSPDRVHYLVLC